MRTTPVRTPLPAPAPGPDRRPAAPSWPPARVAGLTVSLAAVTGAALLAVTAGGVHLLDEQRRDGGYLTSDTVHLSSPGYAVTVEEIDLDGLNGDWLLGTARVRATAPDGSSVFVGVAPSDDVADYLDGVAHSTVTELDDTAYDEHPGSAPGEAPAASDIWTAEASGPGAQTLTWKPSDGSWTVVVMNDDGTAGVDAATDVGATVPVLQSAVRWLLTASLLLGLLGAFGLRLLHVSARRRSAGAR